MKKIIKNILLLLASAFVCIGCVEEMIEENTELALKRCMVPMNLSVRVTEGDNITFKWDVTRDAAEYNLVVASDEEFTETVLEQVVTASEVPFTHRFAADETFYFKVQALNPETSMEPSKWAVYEKSVKTYAVKDNLYLAATAKTSTSVTLSWSTEVDDYKEVDRVEYYPVKSDEEAVTVNLDEAAVNAATVTVDGLSPSTEYTLTLFYKSAMRGEVTLYTEADTEGFTEVGSIEELRNALKTPGVKIHLLKSGSPYVAGESEIFEIPGSLTIAGEQGTDGTLPAIHGEFHVLGTATGKILFEGIEMNGLSGKYGFAFQLKNGGGIKDDVVLDEVTFRNCTITGYSKGLLYEWGQPFNIASLSWDGCDINNINSDGTGGGDVIDIRGTAASPLSTFGTVNVINNTISTGGRTFLRIDFAKALGQITFDNNTIYNICLSENTNNVGIIGIQTAPEGMTFRNNLILSQGEKSKLGSNGTSKEGGFDGFKYWNGVTYANNYYYEVSETFFNDRFPASSATKVENAPCQNMAAGLFNLTNDELAANKVGAPKWWTPYVEQPEDLTLNAIEGAHTWNFGDAKYFSGTIKKEMVRDYLYIYGTEEYPIVVEDAMINFASVTPTKKNGLPTSGYLAFKVAGPGSVLVKAAGEGEGHIVVGVGPVSGSSFSVKGGAAVIAESAVPVKIPVSDITEESLVYVYASDAIALEKLAWSTDLTPVNTALPAPAPVVDPKIVTAGESSDVIVSWESVSGAASYSVVFNGKTYSVEDGATSYALSGVTVGMLDPGSYTVDVYANPGKEDIYNTESAAGTAAFAILPSGTGGDDTQGTLVKNIEQLTAALAAGKSDIILDAAGDFDFSALEEKSIIPMTSVNIVGQDGAVITDAQIVLGGEVSDFSVSNVRFTASSQGVLLNFDAAAMNRISLKNVTIDGYTKSVIYGNSEGNKVSDILFKGLTVTNHGTGQGMFDFRKGEYGNVTITESTISGGRDFFRMDAAVVNTSVEISKNTLYKLNPGNNSNGLFYLRSTSNSSYVVKDNLIHTLTSVLGKVNDAVKVPAMSNNLFYGLGESVFNEKITQETATAGNGGIIDTDPVKDAEGGDFTLVNGLAMGSNVGDPKWNPAYDPGAGDDSFTVKSVEEFDAAIAAGKTAITLALSGSPYDLTASAAIVVKDLRLSGETDGTSRPAVTLPKLNLSGEMGSIIVENLDINGPADNLFNVADAGTVIEKIIIQNCAIKGLSKSVFYDNAGGAGGALKFSNLELSELVGGQGTFDIRKGSYTSLAIENCTVSGGRDLVRADAGIVSSSISIVNNTIVDACTSSGNGILYVRSSPDSYIVRNNLIMFSELSTKVLGKSGVTVPLMSNNHFYNTDEATYWAGGITKEEATANGGSVLSASPVADIAGGDYTVTDAAVKTAGAGASKWL